MTATAARHTGVSGVPTCPTAPHTARPQRYDSSRRGWTIPVGCTHGTVIEIGVTTVAKRRPGSCARGSRFTVARMRIAVVGAHLSGQPLNHQLTSRGATLVATT